MSRSATTLSAHFVRCGVAAVALVAALLGAHIVCCDGDAAAARAGVSLPALQHLVGDDTHDHGCGHHMSVGVEQVMCPTAPRNAGDAAELLLPALVVLGGLVAATSRRAQPGSRHRRRRSSGGLRFGRLLLLDVSVART